MRIAAFLILFSSLAAGQTPAPVQVYDTHAVDRILKSVDDLMWHVKMDGLAEVNKVRFTSTPPAKEPNPTAQGFPCRPALLVRIELKHIIAVAKLSRLQLQQHVLVAEDLQISFPAHTA